MGNKKCLVAYFSCSGVTGRVACDLASVVGGDVYEIQPEVAYTKADLDWTDNRSRSTIEMNDSSCRPAIGNKVDDMAQYDVVFVGFPIWWYIAPSIINTFLEVMTSPARLLFRLRLPAVAVTDRPIADFTRFVLIR